MVKLTGSQKWVLGITTVPMAVVGGAGGYATYRNMSDMMNGAEYALSIVAAGEGAVFVAALISLSLTLLGRMTPGVVRAALWLLPLVASAVGVVVAADLKHAVVVAVAPLAMTVAGEGISLIARNIVAVQTGVDLEQQRRSGLLLWHANRAQNGSAWGRRMSTAAVWRLSKKFAETDGQMSVQLGEVQRYRIGAGADANLAAVLSGKQKAAPALPVAPKAAVDAAPAKAVSAPVTASQTVTQLPAGAEVSESAQKAPEDDGYEFIKGVLEEAAQIVAADPGPKLLTAAEAADLKGVSPGTVRSWKHRGVLHLHGLMERNGLYETI